jgi:hypothetical protein
MFTNVFDFFNDVSFAAQVFKVETQSEARVDGESCSGFAAEMVDKNAFILVLTKTKGKLIFFLINNLNLVIKIQ